LLDNSYLLTEKQVLIHTIRNEIASCSEKAYPSIPISSAKTLFFLDSEGSVVKFAKERGWTVADGRLSFPDSATNATATGVGTGVRSEREILSAAGAVIENTIGYARELETIV
jgi:26S proteasome regulatory subunit N12